MLTTSAYSLNDVSPLTEQPTRGTTAAGDSGATHTLVRPEDAVVLEDVKPAAAPLRAVTADGGLLVSTHEGLLPAKGISDAARHAHVMPGLTTNLISLGQLCDDGLIVVLTKSKLTAYPKEAVQVQAMKGSRPTCTYIFRQHSAAISNEIHI